MNIKLDSSQNWCKLIIMVRLFILMLILFPLCANAQRGGANSSSKGGNSGRSGGFSRGAVVSHAGNRSFSGNRFQGSYYRPNYIYGPLNNAPLSEQAVRFNPYNPCYVGYRAYLSSSERLGFSDTLYKDGYRPSITPIRSYKENGLPQRRILPVRQRKLDMSYRAVMNRPTFRWYNSNCETDFGYGLEPQWGVSYGTYWSDKSDCFYDYENDQWVYPPEKVKIIVDP